MLNRTAWQDVTSNRLPQSFSSQPHPPTPPESFGEADINLMDDDKVENESTSIIHVTNSPEDVTDKVTALTVVANVPQTLESAGVVTFVPTE